MDRADSPRGPALRERSPQFPIPVRVMNPVLTFDTTHHALWAEEIAREENIPHEVVAAPPAARARCNIAIETLESEVARFSGLLEAVSIAFSVYRPGSSA